MSNFLRNLTGRSAGRAIMPQARPHLMPVFMPPAPTISPGAVQPLAAAPVPTPTPPTPAPPSPDRSVAEQPARVEPVAPPVERDSPSDVGSNVRPQEIESPELLRSPRINPLQPREPSRPAQPSALPDSQETTSGPSPALTTNRPIVSMRPTPRPSASADPLVSPANSQPNPPSPSNVPAIPPTVAPRPPAPPTTAIEPDSQPQLHAQRAQAAQAPPLHSAPPVLRVQPATKPETDPTPVEISATLPPDTLLPQSHSRLSPADEPQSSRSIESNLQPSPSPAQGNLVILQPKPEPQSQHAPEPVGSPPQPVTATQPRPRPIQAPATIADPGPTVGPQSTVSPPLRPPAPSIERVQPAPAQSNPVHTPRLPQDGTTGGIEVRIGAIELQIAPPTPPPTRRSTRRAHGFETFRRLRDYGGWEQ